MSALRDPGPIEFEAEIQKGSTDNGGAWVDFPFNLKETYGKGNLVPVKARFDDKVDYRGSLAMMGGDRAMLLLRKDVREQLAKEPGQSVQVTVWLDAGKRNVELESDVRSAFEKAELLERFFQLPFSHQREHLGYIVEAKKPETRMRRIEKTIAALKEKA
ncbi:MAG: DUF1905 domain-containing protein [Candidatus Berkelbacteria bacterium]|nr:MAG: DUF1905 domain-containing protein [Candidatus Berkelbacteria bacterium]QQG51770.1 MAG: DUF1905 domain-containing protein [Candidatus Berkelbacteria bacterium]